MMYHLFLNFDVKVVKIAPMFCLDLAVQRYMSTSVYHEILNQELNSPISYMKHGCNNQIS